MREDSKVRLSTITGNRWSVVRRFPLGRGCGLLETWGKVEAALCDERIEIDAHDTNSIALSLCQ
jgi:hypothetical protein